MYYLDGQKAELEFCNLLEAYGGATLETSTELQYKDIDLTIKKCQRTISVKDQTQADKFKAFLFEYRQESTVRGVSTDGCFNLCEADLYALASPAEWFVLDVVKFKAWVKANLPSIRTIRTTAQTEAYNRRVKGENSFDRTFNHVVTYKQIEESGALLYKCNRL